MTLTLLWHRYASECRSSNLKFYQQTQYCALYRRYRQKNSVTLRFDHQPGEVLEIDWAGDALYNFEPIEEQRVKVSLFVASFSFSGYFYAEGFTNERVQNWITANVHALEHFGGVPLILKPDNTKTAVIKADKYEPTLQKAYQEMAEYYHTVIIPARVKRPKDYQQFL
jgi:transposase